MSLTARLKDYFVAGIFLVAPLAITVLIVSLMADWALMIVNPIVEQADLISITSNNELLAQSIATSVVLVLIILLGVISNNRLGQGLKNLLGRFVHLVPLFGSVYLSVHQVAASLNDKDNKFDRLVMMEYPRKGVRSIGMVTAKAPTAVQRVTDEEMFSVFFPNSPNPTGGRTVMVPESEFTEIDMSVQEGLKLMLTTGMAYEDHELPESLKKD